MPYMENEHKTERKSYYQKKGGAGGKREGAGRPKRKCPMQTVQVPAELAGYIKVASEAIAVQMHPQDESRCKYSEEERMCALKRIRTRTEVAIEQLETRRLRRIEEEMNRRQYHFEFDNNKIFD